MRGIRGKSQKWVTFRKMWAVSLFVLMVFSGFSLFIMNSRTGTVVFEDDVEPTGDPEWTHASVGGGGIDLWHVTKLDPAGQSKSWWCGKESTGTYEDADSDTIPDETPDDWLNDALFTPILDLSTFENADLEFTENYSTEPGVDQCWVELSRDSGITWPTVLMDGSARTGSTGGWQQVQVVMPAPYTSTMQIRFRFDTQNGLNNAFTGWFIDNIKINGTRQLLYPDQERMGVPGMELNYTLTVNNTQGFSDSFDLNYSSSLGWTHSFFQTDGVTPLTDTNLDPQGQPDTDVIPSDSSMEIVVKVTVPANAALPSADIGTVNATSFAGPSFSDEATLISSFDFNWYDSFENLTRTETKNNVIYSNSTAELIGFTIQNGTNWTKYGMVMDVGSPGANDDRYIHRGAVMKDEGIYKLWYTSHRNNTVNRRIMYAESLDGITWNKMGVVVNIGVAGQPDDRRACSPEVIKDYEAPPSERYKMWYCGQQLGIGFRICYATSPDGLAWTKWGLVMDLGPAAYDLNQVRPATVIKTEDGTYRMWYYGMGNAHWSINYATSPDGLSWTKYAGNPVFDINTPGTMDDFMVLRPDVTIDAYGKYHMWYQGNNQRTNRIFYATSSDGISWVRHGVAIDLGPLGSYDDNHTAGPMVINDDDGLLKMWYTGYDQWFFRLMYATLPLINVTAGNITSNTISPPKYNAWSKLYVNKTEPMNTYINITILNASSGLPIPGYINLSGEVIDMSGLDWKLYPSIKLQADFTGFGAVSPSLDYWGIHWEALPGPIAHAGPDDYADEGGPYTFDGSLSTATAGIVNYSWDIDAANGIDWMSPDYAGALLWDPTHTYDIPGVYIVTLNITDANGMWDTQAMILVVRDITKPVMDAGSDGVIDEDIPYVFNATASYDPEGGVIVWYNWSFGDGNYDNGSDPTPTHIYDNPGVYTVTLVITDAGGNWNQTSIAITVYDITPPMADAGGDITAYEFVPFELNASLSTDNNGTAGLNYSWDVDGDLIPDYFGIIAWHTYFLIGTYNVTLNVTDLAGNWNVTTIRVEVYLLNFPLANAGPDDVVNEDAIYIFNGSASINSTGSWFNWSFTDGTYNNGTDMFPAHVYPIPGVYIVTLNVTNATGSTVDTCIITVIDITIPSVDAGSNETIDEDTVHDLNATGSGDNVGIVWYNWSFGDGGFDFGGNAEPAHTYTLPGIYLVSVNVSDAAGNWNETTITITVRDITPPVADAGSNTTLDEDMYVIFNGSGSYDPEAGNIVWYNWSFGDGSFDYGSNVSSNHTYSIPGIYTATLNVTDSRGGNWNRTTVTITVNDTTRPNADAGPNDSIKEETPYNFDSSGSYDADGLAIAQFLWDFDLSDGVNWLNPDSNATNPQYTYTVPGIYSATLRVVDGVGNWDEDVVVITVLDITPPYADSGSDDSVDEDTVYFFDAAGSFDSEGGSIAGYAWDMDDSDGVNWASPDSIGISPSHMFKIPGTYTVTLNVTDTSGNWALDTVIITVLDVTSPTADAGGNDTAVIGQPYEFDPGNSSDPEGGTIISYKWDLNSSDGLDWSSPDFEGQFFNFTFLATGTYLVTLRVEDGSGNIDFDTVEITVIPADIIPPESPGNLKVELVPAGRILNISWDPNTEPDLDYYELYFSSDNVTYTKLVDIPSGTNVYAHSGLSNGMTYYYYVVAVDSGSNPSAGSVIVSGIPNIDTDLDGLTNPIDPDNDNDGLSDEEEASLGTNPMEADTDGDGHDDNKDTAPLDPGQWGVQESSRGRWFIVAMAIVVIVVLIILFLLFKLQKDEPEAMPEDDIAEEQPEDIPPPPWLEGEEPRPEEEDSEDIPSPPPRKEEEPPPEEEQPEYIPPPPPEEEIIPPPTEGGEPAKEIPPPPLVEEGEPPQPEEETSQELPPPPPWMKDKKSPPPEEIPEDELPSPDD